MSKKAYYRILGETMIRQFNRRGMEAFYCNSSEEAVEKALSLMPKGSSVTWGGSETIKESGLVSAVSNGDYQVIDRMSAKTPEEQRRMRGMQMTADYFLMSTNAFTKDGQLVNIDGTGSRLSFLVYGPEHVLVIAGMNKLTDNVEDALHRVHDQAAPPNGVRLKLKTPCALTGQCTECFSNDCMCCHEVITRYSRIPGRITVIMVGEELGY